MRGTSAATIVACMCILAPSVAMSGDCRSITSQPGSGSQHLSEKFALAIASCAELEGEAPVSSAIPTVSEQLRLYDAPVAQAQIALPASAAKPVKAGVRARTSAAPRAREYWPMVQSVSRDYDIDPAFMQALIHAESGHNAGAVSHKGARGLMQVMPATAQRFGVADAASLADPMTNLRVGAAYLKTLQGMFGNNLPLVLAAYNAGEGAVIKHGRRIPPYSETQAYVGSVLGTYGAARGAAGLP
jgi:soluble lytic murein transglycosylase-like protein